MNRKLLGGAVLGASILAAVLSLNKPKSRYALSVSEFLAHPARAELSVRYPYCIVPDTFRDAPGFELEQVTVEGKLCGSCHSFEASQIVAKARGPYEMKERSGRGVSKAPIGL